MFYVCALKAVSQVTRQNLVEEKKKWLEKLHFLLKMLVWMLRAEMHAENAEMQTKSVKDRKNSWFLVRFVLRHTYFACS